MEKSFNSIAWREAATGGFYMGLTYAILAIAGHLMRSHTGVASLAGALGFFSIAGFLYFYSSRMAALRGAAGFSFGQSMAFVLRMSLFAGILGGLGMFVLYKWVDTEVFRQQMDLAIATYVENGWDEKAVESAGTIAARMMGNPLFVVFSGVGTMIIYGGLLGLIVSLFVKRHGDPFAGANNGQNGTTPPQSE